MLRMMVRSPMFQTMVSALDGNCPDFMAKKGVQNI